MLPYFVYTYNLKRFEKIITFLENISLLYTIHSRYNIQTMPSLSLLVPQLVSSTTPMHCFQLQPTLRRAGEFLLLQPLTLKVRRLAHFSVRRSSLGALSLGSAEVSLTLQLV